MDTARKNQMETTNLLNTGNQPALYENVRLCFTPSFFSHGWEYSLSPITEFPNSQLDTAGNFRLKLADIKNILSTLWKQRKKLEVVSEFTTAITSLFL